MTDLAPPLGLLAELTHRCPLKCPYCSNPMALTGRSGEIETADWQRVIREAAELGVLQIHFSGGEPTARRDLEALIETAAAAGIYTNLITAGVLLDEARIDRLVKAGLNHVQLSVQDCEPANADRIAGFAGGHERKLATARRIRAAGLPLTVNAVMHRQNLDNLAAIIELAVALDAERLEVAHVQYYGWAMANRANLMPSRDQLIEATETVAAARDRLQGRLMIDYVVPDYYARRPKACMGGWGRQFLAVAPDGRVLPCHAAATIDDMTFENVRDRPLGEIWRNAEAFERFRGTDWMPEPCRSCERREIDWGGCRCQALALTGDAANTDPACELSPHHRLMADLAEEAAGQAPGEFVYRVLRA